MTRISAQALAIARPVIQVLVAINIFYACLLIALLVFSFFIQGWPARPLGFDLVNAHPWLGWGLRGIVVVGVAGAVVVHTVLRRLLSIVDTVQVGDPFILDNARRLEEIAWRVLSLEGLRLVVAGIAWLVWDPGKLYEFSFAPWLSVLLFFVLAGVFAHGARLRDDLEGTV